MVRKFAKAGLTRPSLFEAMAAAVEDGASALGPREIAAVAKAFSSVYYFPDSTFGALYSAALPRLGQFRPMSLALFASACAKAGHTAPALFDAVCDEVRARPEAFNHIDIAQLLWSLHRAGGVSQSSRRREAFLQLAAAAVPRLRSASPNSMALIAWSCSFVPAVTEPVLAAIAAEVANRAAAFSVHSSIVMIIAFARPRYHAPALFEEFGRELSSRLDECEIEHLVHLAWAFRAVDVRSERIFAEGSRFAELCSVRQARLLPTALAELHRWQQWRDSVCAHGSGLDWPPLAEPLRSRCEHAARRESTFENNVQGLLQSSLNSLLRVISSCQP